MVSVRATGPGDWELVRDVRLAALRDAPDAFASTYEREAAYTEEQWRGWFSDRFAMFLAHLEDRAEPAGLAGVFDAGDGAGLVSMWVRPDARGRGVGEALMNAAAGWAKDRGHDAMYLWVAEANERPGGCTSATGSPRPETASRCRPTPPCRKSGCAGRSDPAVLGFVPVFCRQDDRKQEQIGRVSPGRRRTSSQGTVSCCYQP